MAGASLRAEPGLAAHAAACHERWARLGLPPTDIPFDDGVSWHHVVRMPLKEGSISQTIDGTRTAPLLGTLPSEDVGVVAAVTYPNFWLEASCDYAFVMRLLPRSATESVLQLTWLVHEDAIEGVDYDGDRVAQVWALTNAQDRRLCEENHVGVASPAYIPGPYGPDEVELAKFVHWYLRRTGSLADAA
jgi:Rieske 2Fe-2S family protein